VTEKKNQQLMSPIAIQRSRERFVRSPVANVRATNLLGRDRKKEMSGGTFWNFWYFSTNVMLFNTCHTVFPPEFLLRNFLVNMT
jgi:hypothetical protein